MLLEFYIFNFHYMKKFKYHFFGAIVFLSTIMVWYVWYAAWTNLIGNIQTQENWDTINKDTWNTLVTKLNQTIENVNFLNSNLSSSIPSWAVMTFNLDACPTWWTALASANRRTIVGVWNDGQWNTYTRGITWWEAKHTLTTAEMPSHNHSVNDPWHSHAYYVYSIAGWTWPHSDNFSYQWNQWAFSTSASSSNISINANWWGQSHENRMPYLALLYCQKN